MTDSELNATTPGILANADLSASQGRDNRGLLTADVVKQTVASLTAQGTIPKSPPLKSSPAAVEAFMRADDAYITAFKTEYCYYEVRYKYSLQQLINKLQVGYTQTDTGNQALIQQYLTSTRALNQRLNDLTQIGNEVTRLRLQEVQGQNSSINSLNAELEERGKKLQAQNEILNSEQGSAKLYKDMVKYTTERVSSTNNLLTLYSCLNVVALGLLFYVYRSAEE